MNIRMDKLRYCIQWNTVHTDTDETQDCNMDLKSEKQVMEHTHTRV